MNLEISAGVLPTGRACPQLSTEAGSIVCLVGDNGAGKTTLLRGLSGTVRTALVVKLGDADLGGLSTRERVSRGLCTLEPDRCQFASLTVKEHLNLSTWALAQRPPASKIADAIEQWRLPPTRLGSQLSGGERQRLLFARADVLQPKVLVVDEPFRHCDLSTADEVAEALVRWAKQGVGILLLCHPKSRAISLAHTSFQLSSSATSSSLG